MSTGSNSTTRCCASTAAVVMLTSLSVSRTDPVSATANGAVEPRHGGRELVTDVVHAGSGRGDDILVISEIADKQLLVALASMCAPLLAIG